MSKVPKITDRKQLAKDLEKRTRIFAVKIIRLSSTLNNTPECLVIRNQINKSGTSIGANHREANRSRSRADFKNKKNFVKVSPAKLSIGWKSSLKLDG